MTRIPRASTALTVPVALGAATFPSLLPLQPVALGVLFVLSLAVVLPLARWVAGPVPRLTGRARHATVALGGALTAYVGFLAVSTQDAMRARIGMEPLSATDALTAVSTATALAGLGLGVRAAWRRRTRWSRRAVALATGLAVSTFAPASAQAAAPVSDQVLLSPSGVGAVRAYAGLDDSADDATRARIAVDRLEAAGGLDRDHLVVAIPTGSGWVNPEFVAGLERRFGADVATVSMQYDSRPSWVAFLLDREGAVEGARALLDEVTTAVGALPEGGRPQVHVVGESLGATAGQAALLAPDATHLREAVCSTFWLGTPGGGRTTLPRETVAANVDDPIVHARPSMALVPPDTDRPWLPLVSVVHAGVDVVASLAVPAGAGHRYGEDQPQRLRTC